MTARLIKRYDRDHALWRVSFNGRRFMVPACHGTDAIGTVLEKLKVFP